MAKACAGDGVGVYENLGPEDDDLILGTLKVGEILPHTDTDKLVRVLVDRGYTVSKSPSADVAGSIAGSHNWREAVTNIVDFHTRKGTPFTSFHVASAIREHRPDLMFATSWVGHWLRDLFYTESIKYESSAAYVLCHDGELAGINTYGPHPGACISLGVNVVVPPAPDGKTPERNAFDPDQVELWYRREPNVLISDGTEFTAPICDSNLVITRPLVEAFLASCDKAFLASDKLYVTHMPGVLAVSLSDTAAEHVGMLSLADHRGRLVIPVEPGTGPDVKVTINAGALFVVL